MTTDPPARETPGTERGPGYLRSLQAMLVGLGAGMVASGSPVDVVNERLHRVARAYGAERAQVFVLPTGILVDLGDNLQSGAQLSVQIGRELRFDQADDIWTLLRRAERGEVDPEDAVTELERIRSAEPSLPPWLQVVGHGLITAGLALLLAPSPAVLAVCTVLGLFIGVLKLVRIPALQLILPLAAAFIVGIIVFWVSHRVPALFNPLRTLIPPLVTFLPGGMITTGTMELAAGQMVAGASRLVSGLVQMTLLAFAIIAASTFFELRTVDMLDLPVDRLGWWAPWIGLVLLGVGDVLHYSSPRWTLPAILVVLFAARIGQVLGAELFDPRLSPFFGAALMTPLALWIEDRTSGPPSILTFLPAFWSLVPGSAGLIGLTQILAPGRGIGADAFGLALFSIVAIALGVLVSTALYRTATAGYRLAVDRVRDVL